MSVAVLGFQLFILVTIFIAGALGRAWLTTVTMVWVLFTLFGSIFTMGLLALQLITIYFSHQLSFKAWRN